MCSLPTKITQLWTGSTPADIISDVLDTCTSATGKQYRHTAWTTAACRSTHPPTTPIKAYHKPAKNIAAFDITWALGQVSGEDSTTDTYNAVVIAAEDDGKAYIGAQASNAASIALRFHAAHRDRDREPRTAVLGQMIKNPAEKRRQGRADALYLRDLGL